MGSTFIIAGLSFILIFTSGTWLNRTGKPYSMLVITVHKLIGLAVGVYLVMTIYRVHQASSISPLGIAAIVGTTLLFIGLVATGSLLSTEKSMPTAVSFTHKLLPYLIVISTFATIYLL
jgi:hypothetical protein